MGHFKSPIGVGSSDLEGSVVVFILFNYFLLFFSFLT